ncbi:hypothetical protein FA95DRAFT_1656854, partial [Auriscalpium vulgare]
IRVWTIQIPLPGVATMVLAALAISENENAATLFGYLKTILTGLLSHGLKVVSYAADGTSTERSVQRALSEWATEHIDYKVLHPRGRLALNLHIPVVKNQPIALIQDSNHGRKTYRNNAFSGARVLTLGEYTCMYSHIRSGAFDTNGTLHRRDVEKIDRQDDNAATRLFSGHTLHWLNSTHSHLVGTIVYLFVFGELIDAYQNRFITLIERVEMVLRAQYFMEMWDEFLTRAGYVKSRHFLSTEARDITHFLITGFLQLVIIYRDHLHGEYPLLPWLLSTETCEHVFGICRQIVKDFTLQDFHYMVPKLYVRLREHFFLSHASDGKERASGYNHTYTDSRKLDLASLATYPSDIDIQTAAAAAFEGAESLWAELGVQLKNEEGYSARRPIPDGMPPIETWWNVRDDSGEGDDEEFDEGEREGSDLQSIEDAIAWVERQPLEHQLEEEVNGLTYAAAALIAQTTMSMYVVALFPCCLLISFENPHERNDTAGPMTYDNLVGLRLAHHTVQAEKGVRTRAYNSNAADACGADGSRGRGSATGLEQKLLLQKLRDVMRDLGERGVGTGVERSVRWHTSAPSAGTAANAAVVASTAAIKAQSKRAALFRRHNLPEFAEKNQAVQAMYSPLLITTYGLVKVSHSYLSKEFILTLYEKSGGKNGKHGWTSYSYRLTAVSYVVVRLFQHVRGQTFAPVTGTLKKRFALLKPAAILFAINSPPTSARGHSNVALTDGDAVYYKTLKPLLKNISQALKEANSRTAARGRGAADVESENEGDTI